MTSKYHSNHIETTSKILYSQYFVMRKENRARYIVSHFNTIHTKLLYWIESSKRSCFNAGMVVGRASSSFFLDEIKIKFFRFGIVYWVENDVN